MHAHVTLSPRALARVLAAAFLGGFVGTVARDLLLRIDQLRSATAPGTTWPELVPWTLLVVNALGVYLATRLLRGRLRHFDPNDLPRVLVVTGFFGGLTSYSTLYVDLADLWHVSAAASILVLLFSLSSGVGAGWLGLRRHR